MGNRKNFHPGSGLAHQLRHQVQRIQGDPFILPPEQWGVVHAVHAGPPPTVDVIFDAATKISGVTTTDSLTKGVRFAAGYQPHVGDTVCVLRNTHGLKTDRFAIFPPAGGKHSLPVTVTATATGHPTTGTWIKGATFLDKNDVLYVCTASGTPGTWEKITYGGDTGWTVLSGVTSGWSNYGAPFRPEISWRRIGNRAYLTGALKGSGTEIAPTPATIAPPHQIDFATGGNSAFALVSINATTITLPTGSGTSGLALSFTWLVD